MVPLLILWVGIDYETRIAVIFIGTFFQQLVMVADIAHHVPRDLLDVSYTLGAGRRQAVLRVLVPGTLPGVMDTLRITLGWAWTYLVLRGAGRGQPGPRLPDPDVDAGPVHRLASSSASWSRGCSA